jgi:hypothetical protein
MFRALMEQAFSGERLDRVFRQNARQQRQGDLPFSQVVDLMSLAVLKIRSSVNAAYELKEHDVGVAIASVYNKLKGIEPDVARAMVVDSRAKLSEILDEVDRRPPATVPGYSTKIIDGKHLNRTERRLEPLRHLNVSPLPGLLLAVLDADRRLVEDVFACEDGHAQERSLLSEVLETVEPNELWVADRNFCTRGFLMGIHERGGCFCIRHHKNMPVETTGRKRRVGAASTSAVYEQSGVIHLGDKSLKVRVITLKLKRKTRDGDREIVLISNLPEDISAQHIAEVYRDRWGIEQAFQQIAQALYGEIDTLAYPRAALFGFCIALVAFNLLSVLKAIIAKSHKRSADDLSSYYLADEISAAYHGMMIVLPPVFWRERFGPLDARSMADELLGLGRRVPWSRFRKSVRGPKKPAPDVGSKKQRRHVSTKRVLDEHYAATNAN